LRFNVSSRVSYTVNRPSTLILNVEYSSENTNWQISTNDTLKERAGRSVRLSLVSIANERDAVDADVVNIFCPAYSKVFEVSCGPPKAGFKPLRIAQLSKKGLCLEAL
jgi:regulator of protease activity HflC (stomatin/prohibitin superfamily)